MNEQSSCPDNVNITDQETVHQTIQEAVLGLWDVVNTLSSIQPPKSERYRVTIFGSARLKPDTPLYNGIKNLSSELTAMGCDIITGGGPGLMQAANEGSVSADPEDKTQSVGIRVHLDYEQTTNPFVEKAYHHRTFFSRLHHFVLVSDAFVIVPGGIGTTLETLMIWQLLQVRQLQNKPFIAIGQMWSELVTWANKHMVDIESPMASPKDMEILQCVDSCDEAIALLKEAHKCWNIGK